MLVHDVTNIEVSIAR